MIHIVIGFILGLLAGAGGYAWVQRQFKVLVQGIADGLREPVREIAATEVERISEDLQLEVFSALAMCATCSLSFESKASC